MGLPDSTEPRLEQELAKVREQVHRASTRRDRWKQLAEERERELAEARDLLRLTYDEDCGLSVWSDTPLGQKVRAERAAEGGEVHQ